ncbi:amino acid ABC transporter permease [Pseudorhodobacter ferrugineus]|uniref:amino acid ABC transporter permease n=1 Tax=Pseudorhodobacter ferrugineus TaxID=77008 RepID=UPI0003B42F54|nr:amino acid ABC transporter permease [Pseudorhodobacter ferrugineus]
MSDTHSNTAAYVRDTMIPQKAPPTGQVGAVRWLTENLFSGPVNTILTLLGVAAVYFLFVHLGPWFQNSIWNANSLAECREILDGASGACWGVIKDRWHQLLFGFYPQYTDPAIISALTGVDLATAKGWGDASVEAEKGFGVVFRYWRPSLTFILMVAALVPVLFDAIPRKALWFSAAFPFLAFWLLWGGSIWFPVFAMMGFAVGYIAFIALQRISSLAATVGAVLAPVIWWFFLAEPIGDAVASAIPISLVPIQSHDFGGFMISIIIGVTGIALSLPIGILLALGRQSDMPLVKWICVGFIEFIRGVPLITLLFTASLLLNYFLPPGTNFDIVLRVIIMVTLFAAAYMAEVIRGGFAALPRGQYEAADALGLDYWKSQRLILLPQVLKISIPGIVNTFIGLFKDTTLVVFIGILDPIGLSSAIRADSNWNGIFMELYAFIALCFFIFCFGMSRYSQYLEGKLKTDHH